MNQPVCSVVMLLESADRGFADYLLRIHEQLLARGVDHELIVAINGAGAHARTCLAELEAGAPEVRLHEMTRRLSHGACLQAVLPDCRGEILVVCGRYQQIADRGLDAMLDAVLADGADLALPWRKRRVDRRLNQWQSHLFNRLVRMSTDTDLHDFSSEARVIRRVVLEEIILYGDLYRFLPLLAQKRGFKVQEVVAEHVTEWDDGPYFGASSYFNRLADIVTIGFNLGFARQPLRYFGPRGGVLVGLGVLSLIVAVVLKFTGNHGLGNSPLVLIGLALNLAGVALWGIGLLGEILVFATARKRKEYVVEEILEDS